MGTYTAPWQHPYYQGLVPLPAQSVNYPFPPVVGPNPLTASWLANLHSLSILEQQKGGVDIVVCNLDETVGKKELKKKLASVFREHCKVYSVVLHSGEGIPLRAFIKVPKLSDAQIAMSKVNNQKIFSTSVIVTIITEKEKELCFLSSEVTSVLKEAPLHWMPLNKFLSFFYEKCSHPFDMNVLAILPNIVTVIGKPGTEAICLSTPGLHTVKILVGDNEDFAKEVHMLLKQHKGYLLLANFAASYWLKFDKQIEASDQGVCLSDALTAVVNVCIKVDVGKDVVSWVKEGIINGGVFNKLQEFSLELQELLRVHPQYRLPLSQLISAYQKWFDRKSPFDPVNYGFSSVKDLLEALPNVVQVQDEGVDRFVVLTKKAQLKALESEVRILLESQPDYSLPLNNFMAAYQRCFGHGCQFTNYGCDNLVDMIDKLSHIVKVHIEHGEGVIFLRETERATKRADCVTMETLTNELKNLLLTSDKQQLPVSLVMTMYHEKYGKQLNVREVGFSLLEDMVTSMIPGTKVVDVKGEKFICLPCKQAHSSTVRNLIQLVSQQDGAFVPLKHLPSLYRKHFNRKLSLTVEKLHEAVADTDRELQILGADNDQILCYTNISDKDYQSHTFKKLANDLHCMLIKLPGFRMSRAALADIFHCQRGIGRVAKKWPEFPNLDSLLHAMSDSIEVLGTDDFASVCLKQEYVLRCLASDIVTLLTPTIGKGVLVSNIPKLYQKKFGRPLNTHDYGFLNLTEMLDAMCSVVKVVGEGKKRVHLSPLQSFAIEAKQLLIHQGGCISLNRFAPCFQQYYNRPCKAADYGYSRLSEVIAAVPSIAEIRGKGVDKMVILIADGDVLLDCIGVSVTIDSKSDEDTHHKNESPPVTYEGSDTESVIVEEEMNDFQDTLIQNASPEDLIVLSGVDEAQARSPQNWLMAPLPQSLPEPGLHPEQDQHLSGQQSLLFSGRQKTLGEEDLISFREFELNLPLTGLGQFYPMKSNTKKLKPTMSSKNHGSQVDMSNEDMEVFVANNTSVEGGALFSAVRSNLVDPQTRILGERSLRRPSPSSVPSPGHEKSMLDRPSSLSPGTYELSDVEAEILNHNSKAHRDVGNGGSDGKISEPKKHRHHRRPLLAPFIEQTQIKTPSKKATPVKLAVKFSMTTKG